MRYLLLATVLFLGGCDESPYDGTIEPNGTGYRIKYIDNCQYIEIDRGIGDNRIYSLTHKGNCTNPIHPRHVENAQ